MKYQTFSRVTDGMQFTIRDMQFAIRGWLTPKRVGLHLLGFGIAVTLLAYLGPFGTWSALTVLDRAEFWSISVGTNWIVALVVFNLTMWAFQSRGWPLWVGLVLASLTTALPGTGMVWVVVAAYLDYRPSHGSGIVSLYAQVAVLHLMIGTAVYLLIEMRMRARGAEVEFSPLEPSADAASPAGPPPDLVARLPAGTRGTLLHLRMQDHYVEVHTDAGMTMLLLRFRDALNEVQGVQGMQVHRSHWVARAAVTGVERRNGRIALRLVNGTRVPVSRSFAPAIKAEGWI